MAWPWRRRRWRWRRRRPRWRRWRRRRTWRRRPRRAVRRRRVRRRGRGWRRLYRRYRRRRGRRTYKKKPVLTQWQPTVRRRCFIIGYMPLIICGENLTSKNYASHADDFVKDGPFGGGMTTMQFSLRILYDEFLRFLNIWTHSNQDLDLARYHGFKLTLYRHPTVDFIVIIRNSPPFEDTELTGPNTHPGMLMLRHKKILVPSLRTRPSRRHKITVRIGPPKLFEDKWYSQTDICDVILATVYATACDLQYPFGSPLTENYCISFQVLGSAYNNLISNTLNPNEEQQDIKSAIYNNVNAYLTRITESHMANLISKAPPKQVLKSSDGSLQTDHNDTQFGGNPYNTNQFTTTTVNKIIQGAQNYLTTIKTHLQPNNSAINPNTQWHLEYHAGIYSAPFLSAGRLNPEIKGLYTDITYNPMMDKGTGNKIWCDSLTKADMKYTEGRSKYLIENLPLWAAVWGYLDYCTKTSGDAAFHYNYRVTLISPYTSPMLFNPQDPTKGFVPYSLNFGLGKMPGGKGYVPLRMRANWYPYFFHQQKVLEAIGMSGPFTYRSDEKKAVLTSRYKFKFTWGGNPVSHQVVRNPCKGTGGASASRKPRSVQVTDPKYNTPEITTHTWDIRRGWFGKRFIDRVQQQQASPELLADPPKRPRKEIKGLTEADQEAEKDSGLRLRQVQPWMSSQETQSEQESAPEEQTVEQQLRNQLHTQQLLGFQLRSLMYQVQQTHRNSFIHPLLLPRA
ncbi:hypothetical protein TTV4_gp2 [Torque teno virus 4]|uniref:Capsid protein n=1 Tax=Torque teno virus (isolate Chimpanzee/Japan/Pt-TTV6/2000) TaxID=687343 RepID=CAPSD_TTVV8|nr:hypothetical protein TTV4_gp2 [Torque teno virus 4]Q9DUC9.1 RecName: Full=Capsid protein [Torque teno virus 4]BAB19308.1 unnamed protein product [Torque teno virus 4]